MMLLNPINPGATTSLFSAYLPAAQSVQVLSPLLEYVPAAQSKHALMPSLEYVPAAQARHAEAPTVAEYLPLAHGTQSVGASLPSVGRYLPGTQSRQEVVPRSTEDVTIAEEQGQSL